MYVHTSHLLIEFGLESAVQVVTLINQETIANNLCVPFCATITLRLNAHAMLIFVVCRTVFAINFVIIMHGDGAS